MQTEGKTSSLDATDLKRKFSIQECSVVLEPIILNGNHGLSKSKIRPVSEDMAQSTNNVKSENHLLNSKPPPTMKSKSSKSSKSSSRKLRGKKPSKVAQLREEANDEATTNSENSEDFSLEIDWEENVESDSKLVDEFAPRYPSKALSPRTKEAASVIEGEELGVMDPLELPPISDEKQLEEGSEIFVRFKSEWLGAVVTEVDTEEGELLIRYKEPENPPPMEWLSLTSNRISWHKPIKVEYEEKCEASWFPEAEGKKEELAMTIEREVKKEKIVVKTEPEDVESEASEELEPTTAAVPVPEAAVQPSPPAPSSLRAVARSPSHSPLPLVAAAVAPQSALALEAPESTVDSTPAKDPEALDSTADTASATHKLATPEAATTSKLATPLQTPDATTPMSATAPVSTTPQPGTFPESTTPKAAPASEIPESADAPQASSTSSKLTPPKLTTPKASKSSLPKSATPTIALVPRSPRTPQPPPASDSPKQESSPRPARTRGSRRSQSSSEPPKSLIPSKFAEGEKILAKWSDYRMQKFPAVIKNVLPEGKYDVLFYDGFEKTIHEDNLFKTSEEEIAKYDNMTPSEADSFSHMELDSKEARRERKKKIFEGYISAELVRRKKQAPSPASPAPHRERKSRSGEELDGAEGGGGLPKKLKTKKRSKKLYLLDLEEPTGGSPQTGSGEEGEVAAAPGGSPQPSITSPPPPSGPPPAPLPGSPSLSPQRPESEEFPGFDSEPIEIKQDSEGVCSKKAPTGEEGPVTKEEMSSPTAPAKRESAPPAGEPEAAPAAPPPPAATPASSVSAIPDRWKPRKNENYRSIDITRDGVVRKSLVVPDSYLPRGWSKHAVVSTTNFIWEVILLSPDGYQIRNHRDLEDYWDMLGNGGPPPPTLDFHADFNVLAELAVKQREMAERQRELGPSTSPRIWFRKHGSRGGPPLSGGRLPGGRLPPGSGLRRGGRGPGRPGRGRPAGVRTLLPKYRFHPASSAKYGSPPPQPSPPTPPEVEFRCPKEGCDKKFRKESLLQMHIKHYHREFSSVVRTAPNMVELACARSESVNSDWSPPPAPPSSEPLHHHPAKSAGGSAPQPKRIHPRSSMTEDPARMEYQDSPYPAQRSESSGATPKYQPHTSDERRSTIKTILPQRSSEGTHRAHDSDNIESDDDFLEHKKNGSRIFKAGKFRRGGRFIPEVLEEEEKPVMGEDGMLIERLKTEEFINCVCGFREEDGLMIQCDICMCWQHGLCSGIETEAEVPDRYVCTICRNPLRVRSSKKYSYAQQFLSQGKLPTFNFRTRNEDEIAHKETILKRCSELTASLHEIKRVDRSLAAKLNIAEKPNHPKLYMWAKNWEVDSKRKPRQRDPQYGSNGENKQDLGGVREQREGPQPEAPIDLEECRLRLLDHVDHHYSLIEDRLTSLQTQIAALESLDPDLTCGGPSTDKGTKQTIHMLIRDLETLNKLAALS